MAKAISVERKKRGRSATGVDPSIGLRLPPETLARLDQFAKKKGLSRSEAVRRLIELGLNR